MVFKPRTFKMRSNMGEFRRGSRSRPRRGRSNVGQSRGRHLAPTRSNVLVRSYLPGLENLAPNQGRTRMSSSRGNSRSRDDRCSASNKSGIRPIGYKELESFLDEEIEANMVALKLTSEHSGFLAFIVGDINIDKVVLLFKVLKKLCNDEDVMRASMGTILTSILRSKFIEEKVIFNLMQLMGHNTNISKVEIGILLSNCLYVAKSLLQTLPNTSKQTVGVLVVTINQVANINGLTAMIAEIKLDVEEIMLSLGRKPEMPQASFKKRLEFDGLLLMHEKDAPNDFRQISVFPTKEDILCDEVFFRTNLVNSGYKSNDHYLDVQFRLLREDYIRPLREGIQLIHRAGLKQSGLSHNVKSYQDVTIDYPELGKNGVIYWLHFNVDILSGVRWQNTKRLLFGNLVCLSSDNFKDNFLFAVVVDHDEKKLSSGVISVELVFPDEYKTDLDNVEPEQPISSILPNFNATYTMVETDAYFEAYRYVLSGLQTIEKIPLDMHIVSCQKAMPAPHYLRQFGSILFDFSSALEKTCARHSYDVLNTARWPTASQLGLDESQLSALKTALTNQLAIIQGPPGTGKTHVGLKIMKLLLSNIKKAVVSERSPILVVCYTNHALDQFLEGISQFHKEGIVRVGGRCKTESLQKYMLRNVKQNHDSSKMKKKMMYEHFQDRDEIKYKMEDTERFLTKSSKKLLRWEEILNILPQHLNHQTKAVKVEEWLNITESDRPINFQATILKEVLFNLHGKTVGIRHPKYFDINHVLQTIDIIGNSNPDQVVTWMSNHSFIPNYSWTDNLAGVITKELKNLSIHDHVYKKMDSNGFQETEIQCAVLVTGSKQIGRLQDWFEKIIKDAEGNQYSDFDGTTNYVAEESEFVQEMRMLDIDDTEPQRSVSNSELMKLSKHLVKGIFKNGDGGKWTKVQPNKSNIWKNLKRKDVMSLKEVRSITSIFNLPLNEKWRLYRYLVKEGRKTVQEDFFRNQVKYNRVCKQIREIQREDDRTVLAMADVIGMTTTGAAKYMDIVQKLPTKVVIVEEAAEVLEAHIVTAMPKSTEHLILIGDHQQLKPSPTVYELAKKYKLDISLFERMITNGIPYAKLSLQHRMRPHIADLLRIDIYDNLQDNDNVKLYESIKGVEKDVYFVTHEELENNVKDGKSKANDYEASYLTALCLHLLHQGYEPSQITILSAYTGQLLAFKKLMKTEQYRGVYVTAIDNYQGEENDIILLSLVRSNEDGKIGFLSIENRICVALSRAKKGLYCIGNFTLLQDKSIFWKNIVSKLKENGYFGEGLPMQCYNHKDFIKVAKSDKDFAKFPEGGCGKPCAVRLPCGHTCSRLCHADDEPHKKLPCPKPCLKICPNGHKCKAKCSRDCPPCKVKLSKVLHDCGHTQMVECSKEVYDVNCIYLVNVDLSCGHTKKVECYLSGRTFDVTACNEPCNEILECGHVCKGSCQECFQGCLHKRCEQDCGETLFCGHTCNEKCPQKCPPCVEKCSNFCEHSNCKEKCSKPCSQCNEKCKWKCVHVKCDQVCSEPCERPTCDFPCPKKLSCGHNCVCLCGEECSEQCMICSKRIGGIELLSQEEITDDTRFVQLDCGHLFEYRALDKYMYQPNIFGEAAPITTDFKRCPQPSCRETIQITRRYGKILKKQMQLMNNKKFEKYGDPENSRIRKTEIEEKFNKHLPNSSSYDYLKQVRKWENMLKDESSTQIELVAKQVDAYIALKNFVREIDGFSSGQVLASSIYSDPGIAKIMQTKSDVQIRVQKRVDHLLKWILLERRFFNKQEKTDFRLELNRLKDSHKIAFLYRKIEDPGMVIKLDKATELLLNSLTPYSDYKQKEVKQVIMDVFGALTLENPSAARSYRQWQVCWKKKNNTADGGSRERYKCNNDHIVYSRPKDLNLCSQCMMEGH